MEALAAAPLVASSPKTVRSPGKRARLLLPKTPIHG